MVFAAEQTDAVDNPVRRDGVFGKGVGIHGPADHTGGQAGAETGCNSAIGSDAATRHLARDGMY